MLLDRGIPPVCGAALPEGPKTQDSYCRRDGVLTFHRLHLDHEPPLTEAERGDVSKVCDPLRLQLLCFVDHARKTEREKTSGTRGVSR